MYIFNRWAEPAQDFLYISFKKRAFQMEQLLYYYFCFPLFPQFLRVIKSIFAFLQQWQAKEEKYYYYTMSGVGVSCGCFPTLEIRIKDYLLLIIPLLSDFNLCMILWWYYYLGNQLYIGWEIDIYMIIEKAFLLLILFGNIYFMYTFFTEICW